MQVSPASPLLTNVPSPNHNGHCAFCILDKDTRISDYVVLLLGIEGPFIHYNMVRNQVRDDLTNQLPFVILTKMLLTL